MSKEKKTGDIMVAIKNFIAVPADASFREVVSALRKTVTGEASSLNTVLVYDNNLLAGFITVEDVLRAIEPQFLKSGTYRGWTVSTEWAIPVFWDGLFTDRCIEATGKKAREIMQPVEFEVDESDPLVKAVYGMTKHSTENLPVVRDGLVVGIIRSEALFAEVNALVGSSDTPVYTLEMVRTAKPAVVSSR